VSQWPSSKGSRVYRALLRIGWVAQNSEGLLSITLQRVGYPNYIWAFDDKVEIGPKMLARIAKHTGLTAEDL